MGGKSKFEMIGWVVLFTITVQFLFIQNVQSQTLAQNSASQPRIQWTQTYGGTEIAFANDMIQTIDGGFALAGRGAEGAMMYLVKTRTDGEMQWERTFEGTIFGHSLVQTSDGGFIFAGFQRDGYVSFNGFIHLIKLDSNGNTQWNKTLDQRDGSVTIIQTSDGGFAVSGGNISYKGRTQPWLIKTDVNGEVLWNQTYGGFHINDVIQTSDGGFALLEQHALVKTDSQGILQWNQTFSEPSLDTGYTLIQTIDEGFIIAGGSYPPNSNANEEDMWIAKTNLNGEIQWSETYGGNERDQARDIIQTSDGRFFVAGLTLSFGAGSRDMWLVKIDANGEKQWDQTYGGTGNDIAEAIILTSDGGIALTGTTSSYGSGDYNMWLVKLTYEEKITDFNLGYIIGGIVLIISTLGSGYYFVKQRNLKRLSGLLPNKVTKETLRLIFNGNTSKYLYLTAGFHKIPDDQNFEARVPKEMFEYKFLMHPVRLAIMKILVEDNSITSRELKTQLGLTWGEVGHHLPNLKKNKLVEIEEHFVDGITMQTVIITQTGISQYESLVKILQEFLSSSDFDTFPLNWSGRSKSNENLE
ncbi:MAG: hypothetical protein HeimC2_13470 [Candidatus Heimdallarchaeota archaeon LC_2]|nr:MAG: hypothetical protein HeimC2_13470 [Candidatus Heimdallarchaeota archaeon LC_2]